MPPSDVLSVGDWLHATTFLLARPRIMGTVEQPQLVAELVGLLLPRLQGGQGLIQCRFRRTLGGHWNKQSETTVVIR